MSASQKPANLPQIPPGPPLLFVLSGFSGAGKDSIRDLLMEWNLPLHFAVTATTRGKRPHEVAGRDYHFVSDAEFDRLENDGELIERAIVYGQRKGVPREEILVPLNAGRDVLARVDVQGAFTLRDLVPGSVLIFIAPESLSLVETEKRMRERGTEPEEEQRLRLAVAKDEIEAAKQFDYIVHNETGGLEKAALEVAQIIADEKRKRAAAN